MLGNVHAEKSTNGELNTGKKKEKKRQEVRKECPWNSIDEENNNEETSEERDDDKRKERQSEGSFIHVGERQGRRGEKRPR